MYNVDLLRSTAQLIEIYHKRNDLKAELNCAPVVYHKFCKIQQAKTTNTKNSLISWEFDFTTRDYLVASYIYNINRSPYKTSRFVVHTRTTACDIQGIQTKNGVLLYGIGNSHCKYTKNTTADEHFNLCIEYDIPYTHEELISFIKLNEQIKHAYRLIV